MIDEKTRNPNRLDLAIAAIYPVKKILRELGVDAYNVVVYEREVSDKRIKLEIVYPIIFDEVIRSIVEEYTHPGARLTLEELIEKTRDEEIALVLQRRDKHVYILDPDTGLILLSLPYSAGYGKFAERISLHDYFTRRMEEIGRDTVVSYMVEFPETLASTEYIRMLLVVETGTVIEKGEERKLVVETTHSLFSISSRKGYDEYNTYIGKGLVSYVLGSITRRILKRILHLLVSRRFDNLLIVETPLLGRPQLYETTGHLKYFGDRMYRVIGRSDEYILRPMNCPHHLVVAKTILRRHPSPGDLLPLAIYEFGTVFRDEPTGTLEPHMRVRQFTQDDLHVILPYPRVREYAEALLTDTFLLYGLLGLDPASLEVVIGLHDPVHPGSYLFSELGTDVRDLWLRLEEELLSQDTVSEIIGRIMDRLGYDTTPSIVVDRSAAFYGPKIDVFYTGGSRYLRLHTMQFDVSLPVVFGFSDIIGVKDLVVIHTAIAGSLERFIGVLLESSKTLHPVLAPIQAVIVVHEELLGDMEFAEAYEELNRLVKRKSLRTLVVSTGLRRVGVVKNRAIEMGIPYMVVIGPREVEEKKITIQSLPGGETIYEDEYSSVSELPVKIVDVLENLIYSELRDKLGKYLSMRIPEEYFKIPYTPPQWILGYKG